MSKKVEYYEIQDDLEKIILDKQNILEELIEEINDLEIKINFYKLKKEKYNQELHNLKAEHNRKNMNELEDLIQLDNEPIKYEHKTSEEKVDFIDFDILDTNKQIDTNKQLDTKDKKLNINTLRLINKKKR